MATKVDSLVTLIEGRDFYVDNLKTILSGGEVIEIKNKSLENNTDNNLNLKVSTEDSLFRLRIEKKSSGDYVSVSSEVNNYFLRPLKGELIDKYNKQNKHFGVDIVSKRGSIINSVSEIVVTSDWTKETEHGYSTFRGFCPFTNTTLLC